MRTPQQDEPGIAEQAARWVGALEHGGERERAEFASWLKASPQHVREFMLAMALEKEVGELDLQEFDVDELLKSADGNVVLLDRQGTRPFTPALTSSKGTRVKIVAIAATLLMAVTSWWLVLGPGAWQNYTTAIGEQRTFELQDGSTVELNPLSSIRVKLSHESRDIQLRNGEAFFKVEHDPKRPFRVRAGDTTVRAIGTQFTVHRRITSTTVSVLEGRVEVRQRTQAPSAASPILGAGEEIKIVSSGQTIARKTTESAATHTSHQRSLTFSGDALADIAEDFNRYNRSPQILIEGETLRARQFSGVFDVDDPDSLIAYLAHDERLIFEHRDGTIVIKER